MNQLEKAFVWVKAHRKENKNLAQTIRKASWRFNVGDSDLLAFVRERLKK